MAIPRIVNFKFRLKLIKGFLGGSVIKNLPTMQEAQEMQVCFLGQKYALVKGTASHSSILDRKSL